jgi:hypothetical protein
MATVRIVLGILICSSLLLLPLAVEAAGTGYCSTARSSPAGTTGTARNPWPCSTSRNANYARDTMCALGGGTLYKLINSGTQRSEYRIRTNPCRQQFISTTQTGTSSTGVDLPMPYLLAVLLVLAGVMSVAGMLLRRTRPLT